MKILIVNCVYDPEPVVSAQIGKSLAEELTKEGHTVTVTAPYPTRPLGFDFEVKEGREVQVAPSGKVELHRLPSFTYPKSNIAGRLMESISFGFHSYKYIIKNADTIDKVYMNTWPLFGQYGVAKACRKKKIPYIVHIQDIYPESMTNKLPKAIAGAVYSMLFRLEKYTIRNAAKVVVISDKMKTYISETRKVTEKNINVVLNWQDHSGFDSYKNSWSSSRLTFMYLGNIGPVAGLSLVLKAFIDAGIDARLIIAGNGSKREECLEIARQNPGSDIEFMEVPGGEVPKTQSMAHVLLLPIIKGAASSSIPSKLPAYMFSARPVLALVDEGSDTANAILNANCGWVGNAEDKDWLTKAMVDISKMEINTLKALGINGYNYCLDNFSKEVNLKKLMLSIVND